MCDSIQVTLLQALKALIDEGRYADGALLKECA